MKIGKEGLLALDDIEITGLYYVDGNLEITEANVAANAIIYVNGNVTINRSDITGIGRNKDEGSLIIFANGDIEIDIDSFYR